MDTLQQLKNELTEEYKTTQKFLEVYPEQLNDYTPHPKSMKMMPLAQHVVEVFGWPSLMLTTEILDFADGPPHTAFTTRQELKDALAKNYNGSIASLEKAKESDLEPKWALAYKGQKLAEWTKYAAIRHALNQATHHRAQLGVYYRLNDVKVPGSYGPSADEKGF